METIVVKPKRSWLTRNWGWLVAAAFALILSCVAAILLLVFSLIRNSDAAKLAIKTAESSPVLAEQIGSPMKVGWFISGNIEVTPDAGTAKLMIPISGPKSSGTIYAEEFKNAGLWHLEVLKFARKDSSVRLNLLPAQTAMPPATQW
jgi:hypothetical protein